MQSAVSAGVMGMDKFSEEVRRGMQDVQQVGGQLAQIIQQVQALAPRFEPVNEGMQAQATGAEQISEALVAADARRRSRPWSRCASPPRRSMTRTTSPVRCGPVFPGSSSRPSNFIGFLVSFMDQKFALRTRGQRWREFLIHDTSAYSVE